MRPSSTPSSSACKTPSSAVPRREVVLEETKRILTVEQRAKLALMAPKLLGHKLHGHKRHRDMKPGVAEPER